MATILQKATIAALALAQDRGYTSPHAQHPGPSATERAMTLVPIVGALYHAVKAYQVASRANQILPSLVETTDLKRIQEFIQKIKKKEGCNALFKILMNLGISALVATAAIVALTSAHYLPASIQRDIMPFLPISGGAAFLCGALPVLRSLCDKEISNDSETIAPFAADDVVT